MDNSNIIYKGLNHNFEGVINSQTISDIKKKQNELDILCNNIKNKVNILLTINNLNTL